MQTFLPYPDFKQSAACLDYSRLGKQRVEGFSNNKKCACNTFKYHLLQVRYYNLTKFFYYRGTGFVPSFRVDELITNQLYLV